MDMGTPKRSIDTDINATQSEAILRKIKLCMLINGTWPVQNPSIFYRAISIFTITSTAILGILLFRFAFANLANLSLMVKGFSLGTSFISLALKVALFRSFKGTTMELYTILHEYYTKSLADEKSRDLVLKNISGFQRLISLLTVYVTTGCVMYTITPVIYIAVQLRHHVDSIKYILPVTALYPWEVKPGGFLYVITYIFETFNIWVIYTVTLGMDPLFAYSIFQIIGQLRVLQHQMLNFSQSDNLNELVRRWVVKYQILKECCEKLQKMYGPVILWQITTNSAVICTILFQVSQGKGSLAKYILIFAYSGGKIIQTYLYAWSGTQLTSESEALSDSVYFSDWMSRDRQAFRTSILIILTQQPLKIIAAQWITVSLDMFITVLNTAVSYFFLLQTFDEKQL
ncbi:odorant receptor 13a isoform X2 [Diachasma alloeum]|uniref:Odorant receptor n=1 Tax=Diachasma alloeum TaxID=454923 RepID=A0A4E0S4E1_9HYME|nr:odorant receptor 13a isoform X2 [Diachasma alloeum]THK32883.1 odorant receptor 171 [Diachasma alloeum]